LTLKVVSESRVMWATSVPILVFIDLSVLDLGTMYLSDVRQTDVRRTSSLNAPTRRGEGINSGSRKGIRPKLLPRTSKSSTAVGTSETSSNHESTTFNSDVSNKL